VAAIRSRLEFRQDLKVETFIAKTATFTMAVTGRSAASDWRCAHSRKEHNDQMLYKYGPTTVSQLTVTKRKMP